jgi:HK97 family phage portal protein
VTDTPDTARPGLLARALRGVLGPREERAVRPAGTSAFPTSELLELLGGPTTSSGESVTPDRAFAFSDVFACVDRLALGVAGYPLHVYQGEAGSRQRVRVTPTARLLRRPSPTLTQTAFVAGTVAYMALWGEAFIPKLRAANGDVKALGAWIHPARVVVETRADGEPLYRISTGYGSELEGTFNRRDILHVQRLTMDGLRGVSPIAQAMEALGLSVALQRHAARWFRNGAVPGGVIQGPGELSETAARRLKADWEARQGGENAHRVAVLEGGFQWQSIGMPMGDAQFVEQRRLSATETARIFGLPPWAIGADSGSSLTYSNVSQQREALETFSFRPYVLALEQAIEGDLDLFDEDGDAYPEFLMDAVARADVTTRYTAYQMADFMTPNEKRRRENLPDIEGGDKLKAASAPAPPPPPTPADPAEEEPAPDDAPEAPA